MHDAPDTQTTTLRPHQDPASDAPATDAPVAGTETGGDELFDEPSRWRSEAAQALGLEGDELLAAVSPGAACPMVLRSLVASIEGAERPRVVVDLGSGAGGISEWLRRHTGASVIAVEPAAGARHTAATLFPALSVLPGTAQDSGLADRIADAIVVSGVLSLIDDVEPVIAEARRVLLDGGMLAVADLFSAGREPLTSAPNVFRSVEQLTDALSAAGWSIISVGIGAPAPDETWSAAGARVDGWIHAHRGTHPAYAAWAADQAHLAAHVAAGDLVAGVVVARCPGVPSVSPVSPVQEPACP